MLTLKKTTPTRGFSLLELLVVVSIIGLLVSLTMPAVQSARDAARRTQCGSNLRQIGFAIHQYADVNLCLPMGRWPNGDARFQGVNPICTNKLVDKSFLVAISSFTEGGTAYDAFNHSLSPFGYENSTTREMRSMTFVCPSDIVAGDTHFLPANSLGPLNIPDPPGGRWTAKTSSYGGSIGTVITLSAPPFRPDCRASLPALAQNDGLINDLHPIRWRDVTDGMSNTLLATEQGADDPEKLMDGAAGGNSGRHWWISGNPGDTLVTTQFPPNARFRYPNAAPWVRNSGASSLHPGGVQALFSDGSVRFIANSIDSWPVDSASGMPLGATPGEDGAWRGLPAKGIWQRLSTRGGNDDIDTGGF